MPAAMTQKPFTGRKMLIWTLGFFGVIIAVNLALLTFALRTHTGLVAPNSYVASQNFNRKAAEARAQAARGSPPRRRASRATYPGRWKKSCRIRPSTSGQRGSVASSRSNSTARRSYPGSPSVRTARMAAPHRVRSTT